MLSEIAGRRDDVVGGAAVETASGFLRVLEVKSLQEPAPQRHWQGPSKFLTISSTTNKFACVVDGAGFIGDGWGISISYNRQLRLQLEELEREKLPVLERGQAI
ncbi:hypothetical protein HAX54_037583 [Datura stramonium]|uniref:Uncharacterized protein n=1 Tax=Datura stramonium TaxID=4076 RepID=A0ABS8VMF2_DATST|nr:hypothetical protein [Datura stramonium]